MEPLILELIKYIKTGKESFILFYPHWVNDIKKMKICQKNLLFFPEQMRKINNSLILPYRTINIVNGKPQEELGELFVPEYTRKLHSVIDVDLENPLNSELAEILKSYADNPEIYLSQGRYNSVEVYDNNQLTAKCILIPRGDNLDINSVERSQIPCNHAFIYDAETSSLRHLFPERIGNRIICVTRWDPLIRNTTITKLLKKIPPSENCISKIDSAIERVHKHAQVEELDEILRVTIPDITRADSMGMTKLYDNGMQYGTLCSLTIGEMEYPIEINYLTINSGDIYKAITDIQYKLLVDRDNISELHVFIFMNNTTLMRSYMRMLDFQV